MTIRSGILVLAAVTILAQPAATQNYFPLETDLTWTYTDGGTGELVSTSLGPADLGGLTVFELRHVETGSNAQEYHNYWTRDDGGDTWLHGAWNADGFAAIYDPPILYIDTPLALGNTWTTEFGWNGSLYEVTYQVLEEGETTVPLGVLYAYGIGAVEPPALREDRTHDVMGRRLDSGSREASRWYTEDIGEIRGSDGYELVTYSGSTATETASWSGIKALFLP
ncbi:hypothetical protein GF314_07465 [bacterium]|nr:hypothetical protein [bacterium]